MLKKLYTLPLVSSMIGLSTFANATDGAYISAYTGMTFNSKPKVTTSGTATPTNNLAENYTFNIADSSKLENGNPFGIGFGYNIQNFSLGVSYTRLHSQTKPANLSGNTTQTSTSTVFPIYSQNETLNNFGAYGMPSNRNFTSNYYFLNGAYNFTQLHDVITPYIGIGAGFAEHKISNHTTNASFAYQLQAGSKFKVHKNVQIFADLRYIASPKRASFGSGNDTVTTTSTVFAQYNTKVKPRYFTFNVGAEFAL
jgi:opacity protein-like surface antigen